MPKFDPNRVQVRWGGFPLTGSFAAGTFIEVSFTTPEEYTKQVNFNTSIDVQSTDRSGQAIVRIKPDARVVLKYLAAKMKADRAPGGNYTAPLTIADLNGADVAVLSKARIMNRQGHSYDNGTGPNVKEYMFAGETLDLTTNGVGDQLDV